MHLSARRARRSETGATTGYRPNIPVWCRRGAGTTLDPPGMANAMGRYLFERYTDDGAAPDAGPSLHDDVAKALKEIDWVDQFTLQDADGDDDVIAADISFDEEWPDIRTSNPDQVALVFHRFGLRTISSPAQSGNPGSTDDPLSLSEGVDLEDDGEGLEMFSFDN
jgi:hypothetical protein